MTATAADERAPLPGPTWPPSAPPPASFPVTDRRAVLADDPCEAGFSGAGPEYAGIYLHARYFDPKLGTFLSPDPIGVAGGMNAYGYGFGDPINSADRSGLSPDGPPGVPWWLWWGLSKIFGGGSDVADPIPGNRYGQFPFWAQRTGSAVPRTTSPSPTEYWPGKHIDPDADDPFASDPPVGPPVVPPVQPPVEPPGGGGATRRAPSAVSWVDPVLYHSAQFCAGFGDSLSFGLTRCIRDEWGVDDVIDYDGTGYAVGVYTEVGAEVFFTGVSYGLRAAAKGISQSAARAGARHGVHGVSVVHHTNALKSGLFPTAALPRAFRHSRFNTRLLGLTAHTRAHAALIRHQGYLLAVVNPGQTSLRIYQVGAWTSSQD